MFAATTYSGRRHRLKQHLGSGLLLFLGNRESPMNYTDNTYPFMQDSSFLYYWGLDKPGLAALIDVEADRDVLFGDDLTLDDIVWTGPLPSLREQGAAVGVTATAPASALADELERALQQGRTIHFLPPYRADHRLLLEDLLGIRASQVHRYVSRPLIEAVIAQRSVKSDEEITEIEAALDVSYDMHTLAMRMAKPGALERDVAGAVEGVAIAGGGRLAFPIIFSKRGEVLHNHSYSNRLAQGDLVVHDAGAASATHYASDITRTIPVGGRFTERQRVIYDIVLDAHLQAMAAVGPGVPFVDIYLLACRVLTSRLKDLGLMKGDVDEAVAVGAHAVFLQCGVGHMVGLDVHDMEGLGEDLVGYDETIQRSPQFGRCYLRLGKALQPGNVVAVEPGIYFIPTLLDQWQAEGKFTSFINYDAFDAYRDFGGIRIEDDMLVLDEGGRVLGKPIPRAIDEVEEMASR